MLRHEVNISTEKNNNTRIFDFIGYKYYLINLQ